jgi:hypothetical protein
MTDVGGTIERETRTCSKCGQEDNHPHHTQYVAFLHPVTGEGVDLSVSKHVDCCAEDGCPICSVDMEFAPSGAHGDTMIEYMVNKPREALQALFERQGITSPEFDYPKMEESS